MSINEYQRVCNLAAANRDEAAKFKAEIARLKEAAIELLDALSEEQYSTTPPKAWPSIAPAANRLSDLVTRLEDS
jgi:hypothetical protein